MPTPVIPQDQWETEFEGPLPGEPGIASAFRTLIQRVLNRTEWLRARLFAHRSASVLDHPDESVTAEKLAPVRNAPTITPSPGDWLLGGLASGAGVGKLPIGQANGVPLLNALGALASADAYLNRGVVNSAVDWNTLISAGTYEIASGAFGTGSANAPSAVTQQGHLLVLKTSGATTQMYIPKGNDPSIYWRQYAEATWSPWSSLGTSSDIIYGSNSNGHYIRYPEGTQICWAVGVGMGPDPQTITYPAAFVSPPAVVVTQADWPAALISVDSAWGYGTTQQRFRKYNANGSSYSGIYHGFHYIAIGRWR